jgi:spermidine synthase
MKTEKTKFMNITIWGVMPLLFVSGLSSLAYELVWMRELRLVFGSSTMSTSAVLAIFMGGIGFGSIFLGRKAERHGNPLRLYGYFELIIAVSAMFTPFLILFIENIYLRTGGVQSLGFLPATLLRLFLSTLVLGVPTFFMGGTLPAIAKAIVNEFDLGRRELGFLFGINTLGAVTGVWLVVFVMLESFGSQKTLWAAGLLNLIVAVVALIIARHVKSTSLGEEGLSSGTESKHATVIHSTRTSIIPQGYVYGAACLAGFCFFFMELVWYRMLTPLLGGTTYTIGIILAVALFGIAIGGLGYWMRRYTVVSTLRVLALICGLEALFMAVPFALGDRIAVLASLLRPIGTVGMVGYVVGWIVITMIVVLPASIAAGYQFPLLIGLRGRGRKRVAKETGQIYAWNTLGSIAGSLIGGIILLPLLGAVPSWQLNVLLLSMLAGMSIILSIRYEGRRFFLIIPAYVSVMALLLLQTAGPTAAWRHRQIGVGRIDLAKFSHNEIQNWINEGRRNILWEKEGREVGLAMEKYDGLAFIINGKIDGNVKGDAGTQIMAPLISAILHPNPEKALVVGLGTGSSTGWLASIDSITKVDTIEIEPAILEVAKRAAPMNQNALENKKVNIIVGDAREVLMTNKENYDIIFSEPSNPYRAGIASLYTLEFYQAVAKRLSPNGYFSQWVQGYGVDSQTIITIYSTLTAIFPEVETWETSINDLIFVCSMEKRNYSIPRLREKISTEPFRSALLYTAGIIDLEGLMAHYSANSALSHQAAVEGKVTNSINTDDLMLVEFGFARSLGKKKLFSIEDIRIQANKMGAHLPKLHGGTIDWDRVSINRHLKFPMTGEKTQVGIDKHELHEFHVRALDFYVKGNTGETLKAWQRYGKDPQYPFEILIIAEALADQGNILALTFIKQLRKYWPLTSEAVLARLHWRTGKYVLAGKIMENVFTDFRTNPWPQKEIMRHNLMLSREMASNDRRLAEKLYKVLSEPFSLYILESERLATLYAIALHLGSPYIDDAIIKFEPNPPWTEDFLAKRLLSYKQTGNPLAKQAEKDVNHFRHYAPQRFVFNNLK